MMRGALRPASVALWAVALLVGGCTKPGGGGAAGGGSSARLAGQGPASAVVGPGGESSDALGPRAREQVERFCGDCHRLPLAASFPRADWPREVRQGYDFYLASLRTDLPRPPEGVAIRYFQESAPERIEVPRAEERAEHQAGLEFVAADGIPGLDAIDPAIAQVVSAGGGGETGGIGLLTTDMRSGEIRRWDLSIAGATQTLLARLVHPCRLAPAARGASDRQEGWFVGELGSFLPEDHDQGGVYRLETRGLASGLGGAGEPARVEPLRRGLGRVVGSVPYDFDGDGRRDLLVAEFGWRTTGALRVLPGAAEEGAAEETGGGEVVLDPRHGVLDVRVADLDGDGREDIVAAFAQEHETVDAWYALGGGEFEHRELYRGDDPSWGSSGFDLADMDGDGDLDILHANGDTMDTGLARPTHGIRILVNEGENRFRVEEIARMPGVSQASAADLDGDGDLDVVAAALHLGAAEAPPGTFDSLLWVEQGNGGEWFPHRIERDRCRYAAFTLADVDGDRRTDIVAGIWQSAVTGQAAPALSVWLNRRADH